MSSNKIILDLCGGTGSWSKPYKEAGYDVRLMTLPEYDVFKIQCRSDGSEKFLSYFNNYGFQERIYCKNVYGILAAPTCTHFSFCRTNAKEPRDLYKAMDLVKNVLKLYFGVSAIYLLQTVKKLL